MTFRNRLLRFLWSAVRRLIGPPSFGICPRCGAGTRELTGPDDGGIWQICPSCGAVSTADATGPPTWREVDRQEVLARWPDALRDPRECEKRPTRRSPSPRSVP